MVKVGSTYVTKNSGALVVIKKLSRTDFYLIRFLNTGYVKEVRGYQIINGCVRDPMKKSVCGIGIIGNVKTKGKNKVYYSIWHDMINRCYNPKNKRASAYTNVSVSEHWLCFENFLRDIKLVDGFDEQAILRGEKVLDKDLKQRGLLKKVYSLQTCTWLSKTENNRIQDSQQKLFSAISPSGQTFFSRNITQFAREHGLERKHISGVLHGRCKTTKGWKFQYISANHSSCEEIV